MNPGIRKSATLVSFYICFETTFELGSKSPGHFGSLNSMPADASAAQAIHPCIALPLQRSVTSVPAASGTCPTTNTPCFDRSRIRTGTLIVPLSRKAERNTLTRADLLSSAADFFTVVFNSAIICGDRTNQKKVD